MESFNHTSHFTYNSGRNTLDDDPEQDDRVFSGILEIFVHNARNIHNICIYDEQDVYAKFSLTYNPDETISTKIVKGGGKNPDFNEELVLNVTQLDAVLKCEVWMFSRIRQLMEDQLLGFALVPISMVAAAASGNGNFIEEEFSLSSTDLFHSPAGTVKLRLKLSLDTSAPFGTSCSKASGAASISSEVVLLDRKGLERGAVPPDMDAYSRIEFPDINVARENHQMVSEYFNLASCQSGSSANPRVERGSFSFLHLGARKGLEDHEMSTVNSSSDDESSISPPPARSRSGGVLESGVLSYSSTASTSDDRSSTVGSMEKIKISSNTSDGLVVVVPSSAEDVNENDHQSSSTAASMNAAAAPISNKGAEAKDGEHHQSKLQQEEEKKESVKNDKSGMRSSAHQFSHHQVFASTPLMNINLEAEQSAAMQQQIVGMYMKSMQQFTESLSNMKIPIDLDPKKDGEQEERMTKVVIDQGPSNDRLLGTDQSDKKDGSRVFYGSRAFF